MEYLDGLMIDPPGEKVWDHNKWRIFRQDIGMSEKHYAVFYKDYWICECANYDVAVLISKTLFYHEPEVINLAPFNG